MPRQPGAHVCVPSSTRAEQLAVAAAWVREGIARHEQCVYFAEHPDDPDLRAALDALSHAPSDGIAILSEGDIELAGSSFTADRMLDWLRALIDSAIRAGRSGVRVCQEMIAVATNGPGAEYECKLNILVQEQPLVMMCIYDRSRLPAPVIRESFATHPHVWVRDSICPNPRYVPPEQYLAPDRPVMEVAGTLDQLYRDDHIRKGRDAWLRTMLARIEAERRTIARTLHDELGQTLVVLALQGRNEAVDDAIELVRGMARALRPSVLDDLGLVAAVRGLASRESLRAGLNLTLELTVDDTKLDADVVTACYRIIEAALANVVAHAHATSLTVTLRGVPGGIELTVRDNGVGFVPDAQQGADLADMAERANLVGAQLEISSHPDGGTTILARIPT